MENVEANHKVELWNNIKTKSQMKEISNVPTLIKKLWVDIVPQTGSMSKRQGVETIMTNVTHKIIVPYIAGKSITNDMWFIYRECRFEIRFILNPYFSNEKLEIFVEEVIG
jgi:SPP1 family predicted phage head-tail adaptor